jgi:hypothetical protein
VSVNALFIYTFCVLLKFEILLKILVSIFHTYAEALPELFTVLQFQTAEPPFLKPQVSRLKLQTSLYGNPAFG